MESMKSEITSLGPDRHILVDEVDERVLAGRQWYIDEQGYVASGFGSSTVRLHQLILVAPRGAVVDHWNGNRLDNRRCNLRVCTKAENGRNRGKPKTTARVSSRFKGVSWDKASEKWRAKIVAEGRQKHLGYFDDEEAAARAYDVAARRYFGEFARLNFPDELYKSGPDR